MQSFPSFSSLKVKFGIVEYTMGSLSCTKFGPDQWSSGYISP